MRFGKECSKRQRAPCRARCSSDVPVVGEVNPARAGSESHRGPEGTVASTSPSCGHPAEPNARRAWRGLRAGHKHDVTPRVERTAAERSSVKRFDVPPSSGVGVGRAGSLRGSRYAGVARTDRSRSRHAARRAPPQEPLRFSGASSASARRSHDRFVLTSTDHPRRPDWERVRRSRRRPVPEGRAPAACRSRSMPMAAAVFKSAGHDTSSTFRARMSTKTRVGPRAAENAISTTDQAPSRRSGGMARNETRPTTSCARHRAPGMSGGQAAQPPPSDPSPSSWESLEQGCKPPASRRPSADAHDARSRSVGNREKPPSEHFP